MVGGWTELAVQLSVIRQLLAAPGNLASEEDQDQTIYSSGPSVSVVILGALIH
jgi:hypothetical protein